MRHRTLSRHETLGLGQTETDVEAEFVVDEVGVHDACAVGELANVAAKEDGDSGTEHSDAGSFDSLPEQGFSTLDKNGTKPASTYRHIDIDIGDSSHAHYITQP